MSDMAIATSGTVGANALLSFTTFVYERAGMRSADAALAADSLELTFGDIRLMG